MRILVASATAKTGSGAVHHLSSVGGVDVRALTRDPSSAKAQALAALPNVEVVQGDMTDAASVGRALEGVDRVFMVYQAGEDKQYDDETVFIAMCMAKGVECIFRVSTTRSLISLESTGVYAKAHAKIEKWIAENKAPVIDGNPNLFMDNLLASAGEAKATGKISLPVKGDCVPFAVIDPRDVGAAGATILLQPKDVVDKFLAAGYVEIHGPEPKTYADHAAAISAVIGKEITINTVPEEAWVSALVSVGLTEYFSRSFKDTVMIAAGAKPQAREMGQQTTPLLASVWSPKVTLADWAKEWGPAFQ
jgi:uncharacterized protein YbjT (DUF2867 family)